MTQKNNVAMFIVTLILIGYGWVVGYIVGKSEGDKEATDRHNKLMEEWRYFSASRDHE